MCEDKYIKDWEAFRPWANGSHISAKETKTNEGHINRWLESCSPEATGKKGAGAQTNRGKQTCLRPLTEQLSAKGTRSKPLLLIFTLRAVLTPLPSAGNPWRKGKGCQNKPRFRAIADKGAQWHAGALQWLLERCQRCKMALAPSTDRSWALLALSPALDANSLSREARTEQAEVSPLSPSHMDSHQGQIPPHLPLHPQNWMDFTLQLCQSCCKMHFIKCHKS